MKKAYNLTAFLRAKNGYKDEKALEECFRNSCSILKDFEEAERSLRCIEELNLSYKTRHVECRALMTHALISYTRGTDTNCRGNVSLRIHENFHATEKENHKELKKLRDNVIAHHDKEIDYKGHVWVDDKIIIRKKIDRIDVFNVTTRTNFIDEVANDLYWNIIYAHETAYNMKLWSHFLLKNSIIRRFQNSEPIADQIEQFNFDPDEYYKDNGIDVEKAFWEDDKEFSGEKFTPPLFRLSKYE